MSRYPHRLAYLLFFASGISGLIYEIIWMRQLGNVFGNTIHAAATAAAVFMLGLGAGGLVVGRIADAKIRDVRCAVLQSDRRNGPWTTDGGP